MIRADTISETVRSRAHAANVRRNFGFVGAAAGSEGVTGVISIDSILTLDQPGKLRCYGRLTRSGKMLGTGLCRSRRGPGGFVKRLVTVAILALLSIAVFGQGGDPQIPAYHNERPAKNTTLAPLLTQEQIWGPGMDHPVQRRAYVLAAKIGDVLYQQPCYCFCDRALGHQSLRSCYESTHAAHCDACMKELFYTYQQTKAGKKPAQIREAIMKGEWQKIDLEQAAQME